MQRSRYRMVLTIALLVCAGQAATTLTGQISLGEQSVFFDLEGSVAEFLYERYPHRLGYAADLKHFLADLDDVTLVIDEATLVGEHPVIPAAWLELSTTLIPAFGGVSTLLVCSDLTADELQRLTPTGPLARLGGLADFYGNGASPESELFVLRRPLLDGDGKALVVQFDRNELPERCRSSHGSET